MAGFKTKSELIWGSPENDRFWEAALRDYTATLGGTFARGLGGGTVPSRLSRL